MLPQINPRVLYTFLSAAIILTGTLIAIQYAKGHYRVTEEGFLRGTGLLSANSFPTAAQVFIDDKLITATDDTIYLDPGTYQIKILKDGYSPWQKQIQIEKELVTQTNAQLYPIAPSLSPLTFTGVENISLSPDGQKLLYYTASSSADTKNGLYILELSTSPLTLQRGSRQLTELASGFDLANAEVIWSPDSNEILLSSGTRQVLLEVDQKNDLGNLPDVGFKRRQVLSEWEEEMYLREREFLAQFPDEVIHIATTAAKNVYFSPDKKKLIYTATSSASLPEGLTPPIPATNSQPEIRALTPGGIYVYDREEDKNFQIGAETNSQEYNDKKLLATDLFARSPRTLEASPTAFRTLQATLSAQTALNFNVYHTSLYARTLQWLADSRHLIYIDNGIIKVMEYDGSNITTIYSGPFGNNFMYPWPDGSKLVILTSFSPQSPPNLYAIELE
ncbi:MAG TPA: PEGA domain-containing protein [Vitreimonas sp.]|nr:PEGA domain-containing protein [Vitreimonas sp.]